VHVVAARMSVSYKELKGFLPLSSHPRAVHIQHDNDNDHANHVTGVAYRSGYGCSSIRYPLTSTTVSNDANSGRHRFVIEKKRND